jgi:hypothetical protein
MAAGVACGVVATWTPSLTIVLLVAFSLALPIGVYLGIRRQKWRHALLVNLVLGLTIMIRLCLLPSFALRSQSDLPEFILIVLLVACLPVGFLEVVRLMTSRIQ